MIHALNGYQRKMGLTPTNRMDLATRAVMEQDPDFSEAMREIYP